MFLGKTFVPDIELTFFLAKNVAYMINLYTIIVCYFACLIKCEIIWTGGAWTCWWRFFSRSLHHGSLQTGAMSDSLASGPRQTAATQFCPTVGWGYINIISLSPCKQIVYLGSVKNKAKLKYYVLVRDFYSIIFFQFQKNLELGRVFIYFPRTNSGRLQVKIYQ